jgi:hypothetical protein
MGEELAPGRLAFVRGLHGEVGRARQGGGHQGFR